MGRNDPSVVILSGAKPKDLGILCFAEVTHARFME